MAVATRSSRSWKPATSWPVLKFDMSDGNERLVK